MVKLMVLFKKHLLLLVLKKHDRSLVLFHRRRLLMIIEPELLTHSRMSLNEDALSAPIRRLLILFNIA